MALGFGSTASSRSIHYMNQAKSAMDKSLLKISSGSRLVSPGDDPGGIAVAMKLRSSIATNDVAKNRVENAKSFTEMQSSTLQSASDIIIEMQTIQDAFEAEGGRGGANADAYENDYDELYDQLRFTLGNTKLNGENIFGAGDMTIQTSSDSSNGVTIDDIDYEGIILPDGIPGGVGGVSGIDSADSDLGAALDRVTAEIARVGGDQSVLDFASEHLSAMSTNLESALGRIQDVDLAEETANYAALTLRYEAAAAAVAQANASADSVFNLLMGSLGKD